MVRCISTCTLFVGSWGFGCAWVCFCVPTPVIIIVIVLVIVGGGRMDGQFVRDWSNAAGIGLDLSVLVGSVNGGYFFKLVLVIGHR